MGLSPYEQRVIAELEHQLGGHLEGRARRLYRRRCALEALVLLAGLLGLLAGVALWWPFGVFGYACCVGACVRFGGDGPARALLAARRRWLRRAAVAVWTAASKFGGG